MQDRAVDALVERGRGSLWAKPGSGKTVVGATAVSDLFAGPTLITATRRICELVWRQECERWEHLQHLQVTNLAGQSPKVRDRLMSERADFYLINYELLVWLADTLKGEPWPYYSILFDEISKMKWPNTQRFRRLRRPILDIPHRFGLTGSPRGNAILGLWGQGYMTHARIMDDGKTIDAPYAPSMGRFKSRWFQPVDAERRIWRPLDKNTEPELRNLAKAYAYSVPREAAAPEAKVIPVPVSLPKPVRKLYAELEANLTVNIDGHDIDAVEPSVMRGKLLQLCSGAIYTNADEKWLPLHDAKLDALDEIIEEAQDEPVLIFYRFRHELERMQKRRKKILTIDDADTWLKKGGELAVHPQSAAHGLNLHVGGCSLSVWFGVPDSQELWEQGNRRLARKGQEKEVHAMVLAMQNTIEHNVVRSLETHGRLQDKLIDAATEEVEA